MANNPKNLNNIKIIFYFIIYKKIEKYILKIN